MRTSIRLAAVVTGAILLSGCKLLGLQHAAATSQEPSLAAATAAAGKTALQSGRENLAANRYGLAITDFNMALARGEDPAAAYNGLGVAYSRLGRDDLAYRFFTKARSSDPENPMYTRNLAALMSSPGFTLQAMNQQAPAPARAAPQFASAPAKAPGVHLVRDGNREFALVSSLPSAGEAVPARRTAARAGLPKVASRNAPARHVAADTAVAPLADAAPQADGTDKPAVQPAAGKRKTVVISRSTPKPAAAASKAARVALASRDR